MTCKDVPQETCYNAPVLEDDVVDVTVTHPQPDDVCVDKDIEVVRVSCEDVTEEKCISVPEVLEGEVTEEVCRVELGEPDCQEVVLELPQEGCREIVYGYAHGHGHGHGHEE